MRVENRVLCTALAVGATSTPVVVARFFPPYRFLADGGFTGSITVQHSTDSGVTWYELQNVASGEELRSYEPLEVVRVNGTHTVGTATVRFVAVPMT